MQHITSNSNSLIKELVSLKLKKNREEKSLYFIEGVRFVEEAVNENAQIQKIFIKEGFESVKGGVGILRMIEDRNYPLYILPEKIFKEVSDTESPQGIIATIKMNKISYEELINEGDFFVILDSLQDPGNVGTIIRTAHAAGVNGIILSKGCVDLYNPKVLRSTMGSIFHLKAAFCEDLKEAIVKLQSRGTNILAAHLNGENSYYEADMKDKTAIIIGNEANGITEEISSISNTLVKIPMPGRAESLNAAVAASILIYEVVRQRLI